MYEITKFASILLCVYSLILLITIVHKHKVLKLKIEKYSDKINKESWDQLNDITPTSRNTTTSIDACFLEFANSLNHDPRSINLHNLSSTRVQKALKVIATEQS